MKKTAFKATMAIVLSLCMLIPMSLSFVASAETLNPQIMAPSPLNPNGELMGRYDAAADPNTVYLSDIAKGALKTATFNTSGDLSSGYDTSIYEASNGSKNNIGINSAYKKGLDNKITLKNGVQYENGFGVQPAAVTNATYASTGHGYVLINISEQTAAGNNTFYSVFGLTDGSNTNISVYGKIYAYYTDDITNEVPKQIAQTPIITYSTNKTVYEIKVDVTGATYLRLVTTRSTSSGNQGAACAFADACVYKRDNSSSHMVYLSDLKTNMYDSRDKYQVDAPYKIDNCVGYTHDGQFYQKVLGTCVARKDSDFGFGESVCEAYYTIDLAANGVSTSNCNSFYSRFVMTNMQGSGGTGYVFGSTDGSEWTQLAAVAITPEVPAADLHADVKGYTKLALVVIDGANNLSNDNVAFLNPMVYSDAPRFIGYQEKTYTDNSVQKGALRFISTVTSTDYAGLGMKISCNGKEFDTKEVKTIFESVTANVGGSSVECKATEYMGKYMYTVLVTGVPVDTSYEFTVTPYITDGAENAVEYGAACTFTVNVASA